MNRLQELQSLIDTNNISSEMLAVQVVIYRTLGIDKDAAELAMQELGSRRERGDSFEFENYIEQEVNKVPKISKVDNKKLSGQFNLQAILKLIKSYEKPSK